MSKRDAAIYREAARCIAQCEGEFCCQEIESLGYDRRAFYELFSPSKDTPMYGESWGDEWSANRDHARNCRVLALLLMAAMCEAGDA